MAIKYLTKPIFLSAIICAIFFYSGILNIQLLKPFYSLVPKNEINFIQGKLISSPVKSSSGKFYLAKMKVLFVKTKKGLTSQSCGEIQVFLPTSSVESFFPGKLYSSSKKSGSFIFETGGIYSLEGKFSSQGFITKTCKSCFFSNNFFGKIRYFRSLCRLQFRRILYSWGEAGGLFLSLLCGSREYTNIETSNAFKNAGLSHILALSGTHLSIFSFISVFLGEKIGRKKISYWLKIISLLLFVWFAGLSPSLFRALICALLFTFSSMTGSKNPDQLIILCFSFLIQSIIFPSHIFNVGFILSYGALFGIFLTGNHFCQLLIKIFPVRISQDLSSSLGAQIITAPVSLKIFGTFCPIGIFATPIISPLITTFIYIGLIILVLNFIFPIFQPYSVIFINFLYNLIKNCVIFFSKAPIILVD